VNFRADFPHPPAPPAAVLGGLLLLLVLLIPRLTCAQVDSTRIHSPRGALWRAAAVPGWGQLYNRQYHKVPVVYLALGGITFLALQFNDEYLLYRHAFLFKSYQELVDRGTLTDNPYSGFETEYIELTDQFGSISSSPIKSQRDNLRRNRDLSFLGIGLVYGLSILDAYVSAHLLDFDVGEDLTLRVRPEPKGFTATVRFDF